MARQAPFSERLSLADAWVWVDAWAPVAGAEPAPLAEACGRVLAAALAFPSDRPPFDIALIDGYAVRSESTLGADGYNPLPLALVSGAARVSAQSARRCCAGDALAPGADAVAPLEVGEAADGVVEMCAAVARGAGVGRRGEAARAGETAAPAGRRIEAAEIALAASLGLSQLTVKRRPEAAVFVAGAKPPAMEALTAALAVLVARDGGVARFAATPAELAPADLALFVGRSGFGADDDGAAALAAAGGRIERRGLALTPGGSTAFGRLGEAPLLLLPGDPVSALAAYELLAGRLLRRLAGRPAHWPHPPRRFTLARKIASPIGVAEWVPVACRGSTADPLPAPPADGLVGYARADGFLVVPAHLEGYASGARVDVIALAEPAAALEEP